MKKPLFLSIALAALDQAVKLAASHFFLNAHVVLVPSVLRFEPVQNTHLNWFASMAGYQTPVWLMVVFQVAILTLIVLAYRFLRYRTTGRHRLLDLFLSFGAAGVCCSFLDVVFWGGSLDFMGLFNWFTFDIKDIYLNAAVISMALWVILHDREKKRSGLPDMKWPTVVDWLRQGAPMDH